MSLSVINNVASLNAQNNLNRTSTALSRSLERLSSGLKINRGADGPAALVISEQQRAQIAGLQTAVDNTNKAVALVQTAEGALNEINSLLVKVRGLALDSANTGVNDANAQAANQAEIANALSTIDSIANSTQFGAKKLLNGAAQQGGLAATATGVSVTGTLTSSAPISSYTYSVTQAAAKSVSTGSGGFTGAGNTVGTGKGGAFLINGTSVSLADTDTVDTAVTKINNVLSSNGVNVRASNSGGQLKLTSTDFTTDITVRDGTLRAADIGLSAVNANTLASSAGFNAGANASVQVADNGKQFKINGTDITLSTGDTVDSVASQINSAGIANIAAKNDGGTLYIYSTDATTHVNITAGTTPGGDAVAGISIANNAPTGAPTASHVNGVLSYTDSTGATITATGTGNSFNLTGELAGTTVTLAADTASPTQSVAPSNATFDVGQKLVFQIGANAGQTASLSIASVKSDALGVGAATGVTSLQEIDVTSATGSQKAIAVIDQSINEVTNKRGELGAFQANTLESTANNLRATLENTTAAESVIRDTDFASEIANFTKSQVQLQAGATVLGNANQIPSLIVSLLKG